MEARRNVVWLVVAVALGFVVMFFGMALGGYGMMGSFPASTWSGNRFLPWMAVGMLLILVPGLLLVVRALDHRGPHARSASEELDMRYARGDLSREEFQRMKEDLRR